MYPGASVSGWYFWRPESTYFGIGKVLPDQLADYAVRAGHDTVSDRWTATLVAG
jgi:5-methyltetrahydrofolate--homocysteine methyltransferase